MGRGQTLAEQTALACGIEGQPGGVAERQIDEHRSWRVGRGGDGAGRGEPDGGEPCSFEVACDQTDRLVADGSNRHQQDDVGFLGQALFNDAGHGLGFHAADGVDPAHEGESLFGQ